MPRFTKPDALAKHLKAALTSSLADVIIKSQSKLSDTKISPYDTGRFRSSWFASEGSPSGAVAAEGTDSPNTDATALKVTSDKTYFLTNNLPYAEAIAIEGKVVSQPVTWFADFRNSELPKIQEAATRTMKKRFDL